MVTETFIYEEKEMISCELEVVGKVKKRNISKPLYTSSDISYSRN